MRNTILFSYKKNWWLLLHALKPCVKFFIVIIIIINVLWNGVLVFYAFWDMFETQKWKNERRQNDLGSPTNFDMKIDELKEVSIGASF